MTDQLPPWIRDAVVSRETALLGQAVGEVNAGTLTPDAAVRYFFRLAELRAFAHRLSQAQRGAERTEVMLHG